MRTWKSNLRFTIRELAMLVVIVGLGLAWALDHQRLQGPLRYTGNALDLAIEGEGLFCLTDEKTSAPVYTRRGELSTNANGQLVMRQSGIEWLVSPTICVPADATAIVVTPGGLALAHLPGTLKTNAKGQSCEAVNLSAIGQLQLARFDDSSKLKPVAKSAYVYTDKSGPAILAQPGTRGTGLVRQGMLQRNVVQKFSLNPWRW